MKFDINNYKGRYVMHCKTEEEAKEFCDYLYSIGKEWTTGVSYKNHSNWMTYKEYTCYLFNQGSFADTEYSIKHNYTILEWSDFATEFTKADLKDGMVVKYSNGNKRMVLGEHLIGNRKYGPLDEYNEDLTNMYTSELTIVEVYICNATAIEDIFDDHELALIWKRKEEPEPEEMTIEEICKALGKEIKIIKG